MARQQRSIVYRIAESIVRLGVPPFLKHRDDGADNLPSEGGYVVCANHISYVDPLVVAHFLIKQRAFPYFLAKEPLFRWPVTGWLMTKSEQIPVYRRSSRAGVAVEAAVEAIRQGKVVVVFPEGTITRRDDLWPMAAKSGAARIALETGCPMVPLATWGGHEMLPAYGRGSRKVFGHRHTIRLSVGKPLQVTKNVAATAADAAALTDRVMGSVTQLVSDVRSEPVPTELASGGAAGSRDGELPPGGRS